VTSPLIVRLLIDAQAEFVRIADSIPSAGPRGPVPELNDPAWVIAHTAFFHDCWVNGDAQGKPRDEWDDWLVQWADRQRDNRPEPVATPLPDARAALHRITPTATAFLSSLNDATLDEVPPYEAGAWPPGTTVGYLVARSIAHVFAHASELNVIATSLGVPDAGLPGSLAATRGPR
jgi:hypothetical protein